MSEPPHAYSHIDRRFEAVSLHFRSAWHPPRDISVTISLEDAVRLKRDLDAMLASNQDRSI